MTRAALVLGMLLLGLVCDCTPAQQQAAAADAAKVAAEARATINRYCDARQKAIDALDAGEAGAAP